MKFLIPILLLLSGMVYAEEIYLAQFTTLNPQVNGTLSGSVTMYKKDDKVVAYTRLFAGPPEMWHMQNIYTGSRCPEQKDDLNMDGYLDINETAKVVKNIIIPLDGDINTQLDGLNLFPLADIYGSYFYEKEGRYSTMLKDLKAADPDPTDNIVKLGKNEKLNFEGKVVLLQGASKDFAFPESVGTYGEVPVFKSLPIACGVIKKIRDSER